jgi:hypothetical protein
MTVSNEDRQEAKILLARAYCMAQFQYDEANYATAADMQRAIGADTRSAAASRLIAALVNAMVSHGWGPRPTVNGARLDDIADGYAHEVPGVPDVIRLGDLSAVLRECGIEVTDGD